MIAYAIMIHQIYGAHACCLMFYPKAFLESEENFWNVNLIYKLIRPVDYYMPCFLLLCIL